MLAYSLDDVNKYKGYTKINSFIKAFQSYHTLQRSRDRSTDSSILPSMFIQKSLDWFITLLDNDPSKIILFRLLNPKTNRLLYEQSKK